MHKKATEEKKTEEKRLKNREKEYYKEKTGKNEFLINRKEQINIHVFKSLLSTVNFILPIKSKIKMHLFKTRTQFDSIQKLISLRTRTNKVERACLLVKKVKESLDTKRHMFINTTEAGIFSSLYKLVSLAQHLECSYSRYPARLQSTASSTPSTSVALSTLVSLNTVPGPGNLKYGQTSHLSLIHI